MDPAAELDAKVAPFFVARNEAMVGSHYMMCMGSRCAEVDVGDDFVL